MECEREKKEDTILIATAVLVMDVHSAQLTEALGASMKEGECSALGDAGY